MSARSALAAGILVAMTAGCGLNDAEKDGVRMMAVPFKLNGIARREVKSGGLLQVSTIEDEERAFDTRFPKERFGGGDLSKIRDAVARGIKALEEHKACVRSQPAVPEKPTSGDPAGQRQASLEQMKAMAAAIKHQQGCLVHYERFGKAWAEATDAALPIVRKDRVKAREILLAEPGAADELADGCRESDRYRFTPFCVEVGLAPSSSATPR